MILGELTPSNALEDNCGYLDSYRYKTSPKRLLSPVSYCNSFLVKLFMMG